jgi:hypothetical protein
LFLVKIIAQDHDADDKRSDEEVETVAIHCPKDLFVLPLVPASCVTARCDD